MDTTVLLIGYFPPEGSGAVSVGQELAAQLRSREWRVLTTSDARGRWSRLGEVLSTVWVRRHDYSVAEVDVFSGAAFLWAEAATKLLSGLGKPYVLTLHGGNLPAFAHRWPRRVRRVLKGAAAVTVPSQYLLDALRVYRSDMELLPNGVDLSQHRFRPRDTVAPRFIWVRAFHRLYNPVLAVEVFANVVKDYPDARLTMLGPDKQDGSRQATLDVVGAHKLRDRVTLVGPVEKSAIPGWLDAADILLNTPDTDNTPVSVIEAMASGLCVVSTDVGGLPYLLTHERDALLVAPRDPRAMATAVSRLLGNPGLAARLSRAARAKAESLDWPPIAARWDSLLRRSAARPLQ